MSTACSKYRPRREQEKEEARVFSTAHATEQNQEFTVNSDGSVIVRGRSAPKIRAEVDPPTSSLTLYGVSRPPPAPGRGSVPSSYEPKDWLSVTKSTFQRPNSAVKAGEEETSYMGKELQIERANLMRSSTVNLAGDATAKKDPARNTYTWQGTDPHTATVFRPYGRNHYLEKKCFEIGGKNTKTASSVETSGRQPLEGQYQPMSFRQFRPRELNGQDVWKEAQHRADNKRDMTASHFSLKETAPDGSSFKTMASDPVIPGQTIANNRRGAAPMTSDKNPHVCLTIDQARPTTLAKSEVATRKTESHLPVLNPKDKESLASFTTTREALPFYKMSRPRQAAAVTPSGEQSVLHANTSSVSFGSRSAETSYVTATKAQFRGIYFQK